MAGSFFFVLEAESITSSKERARGWKTLKDTKRHRIVHEAMFAVTSSSLCLRFSLFL